MGRSLRGLMSNSPHRIFPPLSAYCSPHFMHLSPLSEDSSALGRGGGVHTSTETSLLHSCSQFHGEQTWRPIKEVGNARHKSPIGLSDTEGHGKDRKHASLYSPLLLLLFFFLFLNHLFKDQRPNLKSKRWITLAPFLRYLCSTGDKLGFCTHLCCYFTFLKCRFLFWCLSLFHLL